MKSLAKCMDIVSAEGYTEGDQRPLDKARERSARTDRGTTQSMKDLQNITFLGGRSADGI
jgi:hypothetical protein